MDSYDPVYIAAHVGGADILRYLAARGRAIDRILDIYTTKRMSAVTPLHAAAMGGHLDCLRLLIQLAANADRGSVPPAYWTVLHRHDAAALLLLEAGSRVTPEMISDARRETGAAADIKDRLEHLWRGLRRQ
jgi:ankyrin repeat protein